MLKVGLKKNGQIEEFKPFFFTQASSVKIGFKKSLIYSSKNEWKHSFLQSRKRTMCNYC
jgi:hypothetical protein